MRARGCKGAFAPSPFFQQLLQLSLFLAPAFSTRVERFFLLIREPVRFQCGLYFYVDGTDQNPPLCMLPAIYCHLVYMSSDEQRFYGCVRLLVM